MLLLLLLLFLLLDELHHVLLHLLDLVLQDEEGLLVCWRVGLSLDLLGLHLQLLQLELELHELLLHLRGDSGLRRLRRRGGRGERRGKRQHRGCGWDMGDALGLLQGREPCLDLAVLCCEVFSSRWVLCKHKVIADLLELSLKSGSVHPFRSLLFRSSLLCFDVDLLFCFVFCVLFVCRLGFKAGPR